MIEVHTVKKDIVKNRFIHSISMKKASYNKVASYWTDNEEVEEGQQASCINALKFVYEQSIGLDK